MYIKVSKSNNYKDLCIRHTFVKREFKKAYEYKNNLDIQATKVYYG